MGVEEAVPFTTLSLACVVTRDSYKEINVSKQVQVLFRTGGRSHQA